MKQKLLAFFALALMAALPASADIEVDGLFYSVYNNEATVTGQVNGGQNPGGDLVIPDTVDIYGRIYPVTAIGTNAFHSDNITSVDIPRTINKMYFGAFINCNKLERVYIHDLEAWCKITFNNNWANPLYYAYHIYLNGEELSDLVITNSITQINNWAFINGLSITSVTLPNTLKSIGVEAFAYCENIESVVIPNSVPEIGDKAFSNC